METTVDYDVNQAALDFIKQSPKSLLIDGQWVPAVSGKTFAPLNPATAEVLTHVALADKEDIDLAVQAARRAFEHPSWAGIGPHERERFLGRIADLMETHAEELATIETLNNGMPLAVSRWLVAEAAKVFRYYSGWPTKIQGNTNPIDPTGFAYTLREPLGVCGAIIPWNGPLFAASWKIAPAIACGNTVVIKPSELTPLSLLRLGELLLEAGLPAGVVNIVPGQGSGAGNALVEHPDVNKIAFTGSTAIGKQILQASATTLKKVTLELGGKSPTIIFPDADLNKAIAAAAMGFTQGSGQGCVCGTRVFIHESIYEEVAARIVQIVKKLILGPGLDPATQIGPITNAKQFQKIKDYIAIGMEEGCTLAAGGSQAGTEGYFIQPTVFTHVTNGMRLTQEEIFGPVGVLISFQDEADAVFQSNDVQYGLSASVWTKDISRAHRVARALQAGSVWVNTIFEMDAIFPFGGYKQSGLGREMGEEAITAYTQVKSVVVRY
ncbi:aldehyde dehydrogenase family protein [Hymenobacter sp. H14-R3]|uniref:aldehyde dehydrogenase family protein n=1 Tax=Hymenobacter sp. H14-R3 TaxID=3046308 RepID=UPI0024BB0423|nr:aldehyde dehydrogenase family protein [Hymenobacter sp. H14-R3]MDJ0366546.1 aldehyde dehydrogenase family protein [Hymenobacter sp. H14-R3]